ncbi:L2 [Gammapapillomavirus sp.]|uniref:L2 n=1 Tax=Gammapapillomavirus sp. TaxID=2049444 RepID=UPI000C437F24|nr:L2 [Gammapapillomavirus sp.]ATQ38613.1 L2 [Gammapapillomavirus sp.]
MQANKRRKRDTVENIYRSCKLGGDCPPDVVNKVENKTLADILLQAFSSIIFLGNLGIGTGKGSAGNVGSRIIPDTIAPTRPTRPGVTKPTRPFSVPLDTIGSGLRPVRPVDPVNARPIDVIDPSSPSIVTLSENIPDTVITLGEPGVTTGDVGQVPDINIFTDTTSITSHPTVTVNAEETAVIQVTAIDPPPTRVIYATPDLDSNLTIESSIGHIDPSFTVFVDPLSTGNTIVLGEEIPLEPINPRAEFEIEEAPQTSTPGDTIQRVYNRAREFYNRRVQQIQTRNVNLLGDVSRAIQFGFENPAFDPEVTVQFEQDVNEVRAAPDPDFADIQKIGRLHLTTTPKGTVRASRLGSKTGVSTRRGTILTHDVHYYYDISDVVPEELELSTFASNADVSQSTQTTQIDISSFTPEYLVPEENLLDSYPENFENAQIIIPGISEEDEEFQIPLYKHTPVFDINNSVVATAYNTNHNYIPIPPFPVIPIMPSTDIFVYSEDFYLHPALHKRKRKRIDYF